MEKRAVPGRNSVTMLRIDNQGRILVEFDQQSANWGVRRISMSLEVYLLLVKESSNLEELRCRLFECSTPEGRKVPAGLRDLAESTAAAI